MSRQSYITHSSYNRFYHSFSGTDALVFIVLPQSTPVLLGSLTTISYSMFRDKKPVPVIGRVNVGGFTRGSRVYAGTLIFTMINQHWLNDLCEDVPWIKTSGVTKVDELPLFDLMVVCANEYGAAMQMMIYGAELTEEGQVISVENIFSENTLSFVARDIEPFSNDFQNRVTSGNGGLTGDQTTADNDIYTKYELPPTQWALSHQLNTANMKTHPEYAALQKQLNTYLRDAYGDDAQAKRQAPLQIPITGRYDEQTAFAVSLLQSAVAVPVTGEWDDLTEAALKTTTLSVLPLAKIINKTGCLARYEPDFKSRVTYQYSYEEDVAVITSDGTWLQTARGYIPVQETLYYVQQTQRHFKPITVDTKDSETVSAIQRNWIENTGSSIVITGVFDSQSQWFVREFQRQHGLNETYDLDEFTWHKMKEVGVLTLSDTLVYHAKEYVTFLNAPHHYTLSYADIYTEANQYGLTYSTGSESLTSYVSGTFYYPNGGSRTVKQAHTLYPFGRHDLSFEALRHELIYSIEHASLPNYVEFTISASDQLPYKWSFDITA